MCCQPMGARWASSASGIFSLPQRRSSSARSRYTVFQSDSGGDEGKPARTVLLCLDRTIAQPAEAVETDSAGEGVARFALVEFHGRLPPQSWQLEPVEHEQRALDPSDFAKGQRQAILAGISSQALEEERSADRSGA